MMLYQVDLINVTFSYGGFWGDEATEHHSKSAVVFLEADNEDEAADICWKDDGLPGFDHMEIKPVNIKKGIITVNDSFLMEKDYA
jgi:hypothetical protein